MRTDAATSRGSGSRQRYRGNSCVYVETFEHEDAERKEFQEVVDYIFGGKFFEDAPLISMRFDQAEKFVSGKHPFCGVVKRSHDGFRRVSRGVCAKDLFG